MRSLQDNPYDGYTLTETNEPGYPHRQEQAAMHGHLGQELLSGSGDIEGARILRLKQRHSITKTLKAMIVRHTPSRRWPSVK